MKLISQGKSRLRTKVPTKTRPKNDPNVCHVSALGRDFPTQTYSDLSALDPSAR